MIYFGYANSIAILSPYFHKVLQIISIVNDHIYVSPPTSIMSCIEEKFYSIFDKLLPFFIRLVEADFSTVFDDCSGLLMKVIKKSLNEGSIPSHTGSVF